MITIFLSGFLIGIITLQIIHKLEQLKKIKEEIDKLKRWYKMKDDEILKKLDSIMNLITNERSDLAEPIVLDLIFEFNERTKSK